MLQFFLLSAMALGMSGCSDKPSEFQQLRKTASEIKTKAQDEMYEKLRKKYTDPADKPLLNLKLSKAQLLRKADTIGSDECLTCERN